MIKFATTAAVFLLAISAAPTRCEIAGGEPRVLTWKSFDRTRYAETSDADIKDILRRISSGNSSTKDDEELVDLIKNVIVQTAAKIKTPSGSIDAAARRAQNLVSELTFAYTTAIYRSKSTEMARRNLARFQKTVQHIVEFTKSGRFVP